MSEKAAAADVQLVTFIIEGEEYGVDVMQVKEIICLPEITPSFNAQPYVAGIINLRGEIVPVINLRTRLGLPQAEYDLDTRIAVMTLGGSQTGFIIDRVAEVMKVKRSEILPPTDGLGERWIAGIVNLEKLVVVIDPEQLGVV